jgi:GNAT superfamily N-acetyltransferase
MANLIYRALESTDLEEAHALSKAVGWPHRLEDWKFIMQLGSGIAAVEGGRLRGTGCWWPHGDSFATVGMIIVSPELQGRGIGRVLMDRAMTDAGERSLVLNATQAGLPLYEKLGFEAVGAVRQHQIAGSKPQAVSLPAGSRLRPLAKDDRPALQQLDALATGMDRTAALDALIGSAVGLVLERDGQVTGFSFFRRFGRGYAIGPTIATDIDDAKGLIGSFLNEHHAEFLRVDVPVETGLSEWLSDQGLPKVDEVVTMVRGHKPHHEESGPCVFSLINQALG